MAQPTSPPTDPDRWGAVDRYFELAVGASDPVLDAALAASHAAGLPAIQVSPLQGKLLHLLARSVGAHRILEIGALGGYSAIWLARALPSDGRLLSLELEPRHAEVARANLARAGLSDRTEVRVGRAAESLRDLVAEGVEPFDLIFLDADKIGYPEYFARAVELSRPGTLVVADNVVRGGDVADPATREAASQGIRRMMERIAATPQVNATVIQTVGSKGYDGFALLRVGPAP
jgi:predicted O-methyltransferase YrrM